MAGHDGGFLALVEQIRPKVTETDIHAVHARRQGGESLLLVDIREDREWDAGHIAGAVHLGRGVLERDIAAVQPDRDAEIILYCGGGFRSVLSAESLMRMGYTKVVSMDGGYRDWVQAGYPTE